MEYHWQIFNIVQRIWKKKGKKKYYEIDASEDYYRVRTDVATKLRAWNYGVAVTIIISNRKAVKNT